MWSDSLWILATDFCGPFNETDRDLTLFEDYGALARLPANAGWQGGWRRLSTCWMGGPSDEQFFTAQFDGRLQHCLRNSPVRRRALAIPLDSTAGAMRQRSRGMGRYGAFDQTVSYGLACVRGYLLLSTTHSAPVRQLLPLSLLAAKSAQWREWDRAVSR